eukprot:PRCOL_00004614-RA
MGLDPMTKPDLGPAWEARVAPTSTRTMQDVQRALHSPVPPELEQRRRAEDSGKVLTHIPWQVVNRLLTYHAPGWNGEVKYIHYGRDTVTVTYRISIPCADGTIAREATGTKRLSGDGYGEPEQLAEQQAFSRAAARCGLGLYLYPDPTAPKQ